MESSPDRKRAHELAAFLQLVELAQLPIEVTSIEIRDPPEPDVYCVASTGPVYFELGRLLDPWIPKLRLEMLRVAPEQVAVDPMRMRLPERTVLEQKLSKSYVTNGYPVELALYYDFDQQNLITTGFPVEPIENYARYVWEPLIAETPGVFRRVWVFERYRPSLLWCYPPRDS